VHFTRLRITGFKSFVDPTEIHIEPGLTGIVGPNGCGKSNLVEGLRWVMGESSAKQMRGGEMDDVIFGGTSERPSRNLAEVILTLDNADRGAPSAYNQAAEIDVSRRIERGSGSQYRINGSEARARDVQTLFADVSSGARSTALVSQGRIGAIINAKPTDRRHLLEEAAGIGGLHSRRHEAELRLRAADANLERLDDLLAALEEQFRGLKRQARQATRYRNLSDHIRKAEAILLHLRWTEANARREVAREELKRAEAAVAETTGQAASVSARQADAGAVVPDLRRAEAETAAALQRLMVARDALDAEERRLEAARRDIENRLAQIDGDIGRERGMLSDAAEALERLKSEAAEIREAQAKEPETLAHAAQLRDAAAAEVNALEAAVTELTRSVAAEESRQAELNRQIVELEKRRERLIQQRDEAQHDHRRASEEAQENGRQDGARGAAAEARAKLDKARADAHAAEQIRAAALVAEDETRESYQVAETAAAKLRTETAALAELLEISDSDLWPPMVDAISVDAGFEMALGAALGDDLIAPGDEAAPVHWRTLPVASDAPALPPGARPLSDFVKGPPALQRRLSQIGLIDDDALGNALADRLAQGQRLVSKSGALWRWDGFVAGAGATTAAAKRLSQRNRLDDLRERLPALEQSAHEGRGRLDRALHIAQQATEREKESREALWSADREFQEARDAEAALAQGAADARLRQEGLTVTIGALGVDLTELEAQLATARAELTDMSEIEARRGQIVGRQRALAERRVGLDECRRDHDRLSDDAEARRNRLRAIDGDLASWRQRSGNAETQISQLEQRRGGAAEELERLESRPVEIAEQRRELDIKIIEAESKRDSAASALADAEAQLEELARALRATEARLADQREERVRRQAAVEQIEQEITTIAERVREQIRCEPEHALEEVGVKPGEELPDHDKIETRLERLLRERDNMGPVNLRAETEAEELNERITTLQSEREDLVGAIARLRQGISGLNREGRERLLAAFGEVDRHFRDLFTRLFGGGRAHLSLTEADDPFEAGLEIMASPPGKKLQTMSLLSGGEQALAALALLFAVFQTNPAPICVLDEVDAPLDDHNVDRFCTMLAEIAHSSSTRFLLVTHHRLTMARMDRLYGVTMGEQGVSQLVSVNLQTAEGLRESA